jgi:hypothetical protein
MKLNTLCTAGGKKKKIFSFLNGSKIVIGIKKETTQQ